MRLTQEIVFLALGALVSPTSAALDANSITFRRSATITSASPSATCSAVSPPPTNHLCGAPGNYNPQATDIVAGQDQISSLDTCRDFCLHRSPSGIERGVFCERFIYDTANKSCHLLGSDNAADYSNNQSSTSLFYDQECFQCDERCPQPTTINLIDDGGFERSQKYIGPWLLEGGPGSKIVSPGSNSSKAYLFPASNGTEYTLYQYRDLCANAFYTFKADIMSVPVAGSKNPQPASIAARESNDFVYVANYAATNEWKTIFLTFSCGGSGDSSEFNIEVSPNDYDIYVDNIQVFTAPSTFKTVGSSIVTNGGFESGSLAPWAFMNTNYYDPDSGHRSVTSPGLTRGKYKFQFSSSGYDVGHGYTSTGVELSQNLKTEPGVHYLISFDFSYHGRPGDSSEYLSYDSFVSFGNTSWYPTLAQNDTAHFSRVATAESAITMLTLGFGIYDADGDHMRVLIDNIKVRVLAS